MYKISGTDHALKMNAATLRNYREKFGEDILIQMDGMYERMASAEEKSFIAEEVEMLENLMYICNKQAEPEQPDEILDWLDGFEMNQIAGTYQTIVNMWNENMHQTSRAKKKTENQ